MKYFTQKINRYKFPLFIILITVALPLLLRELAGNPGFQVFIAIVIIAAINIFVYFLFILTIGRLINNDFVSILINLGLSFLLVGSIFRVMHWPGAILQLIEAALFIIIGLFFVIYLKLKAIK